MTERNNPFSMVVLNARPVADGMMLRGPMQGDLRFPDPESGMAAHMASSAILCAPSSECSRLQFVAESGRDGHAWRSARVLLSDGSSAPGFLRVSMTGEAMRKQWVARFHATRFVPEPTPPEIAGATCDVIVMRAGVSAEMVDAVSVNGDASIDLVVRKKG